MHKEGVPRGVTYKLDVSTMQRFLGHFGFRSIISGVRRRLTVVRWDPSRPSGFDNAVLMTEAESREHKKRRYTEYNEQFAAHVESLLRAFIGEGSGPRGTPEEWYPPPADRTKGFPPEAAVWHALRFGAVHPATKSRASSVHVV
jgi:hypothetical protein